MNHTPNVQQEDVQPTYSWIELYRHVKALYSSRRSYRRVAEEDFSGKVNHAVIQRIVAGIEPKRPAIRFRLGLPALMLGPVCTRCGQLHVSKRCPNGQRPPTNWRDGEAGWQRLIAWFQ
jgi:hypothetical protein